MNLSKLYRELRLVGASKEEAMALESVASDLGQLKPAYGIEKHTDLVGGRRYLPRLMPMGVMALLGIVIGIGVMAMSQASIPGSVLYPVKRTSEHAAVMVNPDYKENVMMRRAQEISALTAQQAPEKLVMDSLEDYKLAAKAYGTPEYDAAAFDYCRQYLQTAAGRTTGSEHEAITATIAGLPQP
jgi:hypothetical protein